ncbi:GDSL-type esterase/lipase family protein [Sphingomonas sp. S1-29]|uniref:GDSL-type esterase/lipase family protein n=1 Tax=Sphingomonas sp. S1-29 TaxID=2991074 RepID=UPI0022402974|nr:GDSL-type esterase/lipase family protein [Sphingomonas sp. S1-29]UZK69055.1 GDSL-type esterase/lipase family protein [Sphingomonas sp. S1-29]
MWTLALANLAMLAAPAQSAVTITKDVTNRSIKSDARPLPVHIGGRVAMAPLAAPAPKGARAYVHQWPAVYWEAAFIGDRLILKFDDDKNEYRLTIDHVAAIPIPQPGRAAVVVTGLRPGRHRARLDKVTESVEVARAFNGFFVPRGEAVLPAPRARSRQIEFIGDSGMTGYGIRSDTPTCTKEEVRLRTDSGAAWPSLVAHSINADYQINAVSGIGLVRNYGGTAPERVMSALYPRTLPDGTAVWQNQSWQPQVVVVLLFNDFTTPIQPGERWLDQTALADDYVRAYQQFIATIHERSPGAALLLPWPNLAKGNDPAMQRFSSTAQAAIRAAAVKAGVPRIEFPSLPDFTPENSACDYHGSRSDHQNLAGWMIAWIKAQPELWSGRRNG